MNGWGEFVLVDFGIVIGVEYIGVMFSVDKEFFSVDDIGEVLLSFFFNLVILKLLRLRLFRVFFIIDFIVLVVG